MRTDLVDGLVVEWLDRSMRLHRHDQDVEHPNQHQPGGMTSAGRTGHGDLGSYGDWPNGGGKKQVKMRTDLVDGAVVKLISQDGLRLDRRRRWVEDVVGDGVEHGTVWGSLWTEADLSIYHRVEATDHFVALGRKWS